MNGPKLLRFSSDPAEDIPGREGPRVVGVDTSLTATGLASSEGWCRVIGYPDKNNPITKLSYGARLVQMRRVLNAVVTGIGHPDLAVLERAALAQSGGSGCSVAYRVTRMRSARHACVPRVVGEEHGQR
ncbi:hypothetical protein AB4Z54_16075 [Streptomyces sp. MCAF7]